MKKLTYLLLAILIVACSSDDSDSSNSNENSINPPAWIQGLWLNDTSSVGFEFRDDNLCSTSTGNTICYKEFMTLMFHVYLYNNTKTEKNIKTQNNKQKAKLPLFLIRFFP